MAHFIRNRNCFRFNPTQTQAFKVLISLGSHFGWLEKYEQFLKFSFADVITRCHFDLVYAKTACGQNFQKKQSEGVCFR